MRAGDCARACPRCWAVLELASVVSSGRGRVEVGLVRASAPIAGTAFDGIHSPVCTLIGPSLPRSNARPGYQHSWRSPLRYRRTAWSCARCGQNDKTSAGFIYNRRSSAHGRGIATDGNGRRNAQSHRQRPGVPPPSTDSSDSARPHGSAKSKNPSSLQLPGPSRCRLAASPVVHAAPAQAPSHRPSTSPPACCATGIHHSTLRFLSCAPRVSCSPCRRRCLPANGIMRAALGPSALCPPVPSSWRGFPRGAQVALHKGPANPSPVPSRGGKTWTFNKHDGMRMPCNHTLKLVLTISNPPRRLELLLPLPASYPDAKRLLPLRRRPNRKKRIGNL
jgi:hypothetical protein